MSIIRVIAEYSAVMERVARERSEIRQGYADAAERLSEALSDYLTAVHDLNDRESVANDSESAALFRLRSTLPAGVYEQAATTQ